VRTARRAIVGVVLATALAAGCGSEPKKSYEFKETPRDQFNAMKDQMINNMKTKSFQKQGAVPPAEKK
jgi:hypothetical protein